MICRSEVQTVIAGLDPAIHPLRQVLLLDGCPGQAHGCPVQVNPQFSVIWRESGGGGLCNCFRRVKSFRCIRLMRTSLVVSSKVSFSCDILFNIRSSRKAISAMAI